MAVRAQECEVGVGGVPGKFPRIVLNWYCWFLSLFLFGFPFSFSYWNHQCIPLLSDLVITAFFAQFLPHCRSVLSPSVEENMHSSVVGSEGWQEDIEDIGERLHVVLRVRMKERPEKMLRQDWHEFFENPKTEKKCMLSYRNISSRRLSLRMSWKLNDIKNNTFWCQDNWRKWALGLWKYTKLKPLQIESLKYKKYNF